MASSPAVKDIYVAGIWDSMLFSPLAVANRVVTNSLYRIILHIVDVIGS